MFSSRQKLYTIYLVLKQTKTYMLEKIIDKVFTVFRFSSAKEHVLTPKEIEDKQKEDVLDKLFKLKLQGYTKAYMFECEGAYTAAVSISPFPGYGEHHGFLRFLDNTCVMAVEKTLASMLDGILFAATFSDVTYDVPSKLAPMVGVDSVKLVGKGTTLEQLKIELDLSTCSTNGQDGCLAPVGA